MGGLGQAWIAALPARLEELTERWRLRLGRPLPGGSASYVVRAATVGGEPRVLKVGVLDSGLDDEARVLGAAEGVGYARLFVHDPHPTHEALLLEALGPSLEQCGGEPDDVLGSLADTLVKAWGVGLEVVSTSGPSGPDKAGSLRAGIDANLPSAPADLRVRVGPAVEHAVRIAEELAASYHPDVVVHGDPHPGNALRRGPRDWAFVDPDGFRCEREYDLGVSIRDFSRRVLASASDAEARALVDGWATLVAERTGTDAQRVLAWGFLERVSTGLYVCSIGSPQVGAPLLESAARLVGHTVGG